MCNVRAVVFDFDGVLVDSREFHYRSMQQFFGVSLSEEDFARMHDGNFFSHDVSVLQNVDWAGYRDFVFSAQQSLVMQEECRLFLEAIGSQLPMFIVTSGGQKNVSAFLEI